LRNTLSCKGRNCYLHLKQLLATTMKPLEAQQLETPPVPETRTEKPAAARRLLSIDTLRGFDMLMISGAGSFFLLLHGKTGWAWLDAFALQFEHPPWNGFTFYDFIFPLFLFIAGLSLPFSLNKGLTLGMSKRTLYIKAFKRMLILIACGIFYKNAP